ncbi:MAG: hypothetical protein KY464_15690 [Gemmatimonadetes bacterium]|nr:hypothetical protein [Gemmatimonadota bacterium]
MHRHSDDGAGAQQAAGVRNPHPPPSELHPGTARREGHVDAVGRVRSTTRDPDGRWLDLVLDVPATVLAYCIDRGSVTVNGTSLTVMGLDEAGIRLQLVPETQVRTNLGELAIGEPVNLEADVIARYVARLLPTTR